MSGRGGPRPGRSVCRACGRPIGPREARARLSFQRVEFSRGRDRYSRTGWRTRQKSETKLSASFCEDCAAAAEEAVKEALGWRG